MIFPITVILAFCSIIYELLLAQALSAFLENTVLRYSITIGLYMFSMGFGALLMEKRFTKRPVLLLLKTEILLTIIGGFAVVLLHYFHMAGLSRLAFIILAHLLIIIIGILTGMEIPLLINIRNLKKDHSENIIIGVDYAGAFLGTIIFAFILFPKVGLMQTAFITGFLNSLAGVLLFTQKRYIEKDYKSKYYASLSAQGALCVLMMICIINSSNINDYFMNSYLN